MCWQDELARLGMSSFWPQQKVCISLDQLSFVCFADERLTLSAVTAIAWGNLRRLLITSSSHRGNFLGAIPLLASDPAAGTSPLGLALSDQSGPLYLTSGDLTVIPSC